MSRHNNLVGVTVTVAIAGVVVVAIVVVIIVFFFLLVVIVDHALSEFERFGISRFFNGTL